LKRFAGGMYAVWYPQLQRAEARQLPEQLKRLPVKSWLNVALSVHELNEDGFGMYGSGMFIINPPWLLHGVLQEVMPYLVKVLRQDGEGSFVLEYDENA
jgi:23S rRNA (adenine2030-N6)-methyltransferase